MPSFPRCQAHGIRACPCNHPGEAYPGDVAKVDEALDEARAFVRQLEALHRDVVGRSGPRPQRRLTDDEKRRMRNFPSWALDAPVDVDASIPVGSITDFDDLKEPV